MRESVGLQLLAGAESLRAEHALDGMQFAKGRGGAVRESGGVLLDMLDELALSLEVNLALFVGADVRAAN